MEKATRASSIHHKLCAKGNGLLVSRTTERSEFAIIDKAIQFDFVKVVDAHALRLVN